MRALFISAVMLFASWVSAAGQTTCSTANIAAATQAVHSAQQAALAFAASDMDSGVDPKVAPLLLDLKLKLALAADAEIACAGANETAAQIQQRLKTLLAKAAPGMKIAPDASGTDSDKPTKGIFGNDVSSSVQLFTGPPQILEIEIGSSVPCGDDEQLLLYQQKAGHWIRTLRWSADFKPKNDFITSFGDFFLTGILVPDPAKPADWRVVVAHGNPWCTSRMSSFGIAVLSPSGLPDTSRVIWQTERSYSRGDFAPTLKASSDTFELRLHADAQPFDMDNSFERLVIYRYNVRNDKPTRIQPTGVNARGFIEEWLEMPWQEALAQSDTAQANSLQTVHKLYEQSFIENSVTFTTWTAGPVQACSTKDHYQVTMSTQTESTKPNSQSKPSPTYYFQLRQDNGYRLLSITTKPDPTCTGPDLMSKPAH